MSRWVIRSQPGRQAALAWGCLAVGAILAWAMRDAAGPGFANERAAFWLGALLAVLGAGGVLSTGEQTVVVDPEARVISVEDVTRLGRKTRTIPFDDVVGVRLGSVGRRSSHVVFHFLELSLADGSTFPLFAPGRFFEGSTSRSETEELRRRLVGLLRPPGASA